MVSSNLMLPGVTAVAVVAVTWILWQRNRKTKIVVAQLCVYPIKSCAEVSVPRATPTPTGFVGDRIVQVTDAKGKYCTPRDKDKVKLFHVQVAVSSSDKNVIQTLTLTSPYVKESHMVDLTSSSTTKQVQVLEAPEPLTLRVYQGQTPPSSTGTPTTSTSQWLARATDIPGACLTGIGPEFVRSVRVNPSQGDAIPNNNGEPSPMSLADEAPYLLVNQASLDDLNKRLIQRGSAPVDMRRFRPNIVLRGGLQAWEEDSLQRIRIAGVEFHAWQRCGRCAMTTIHRDTLQRGPEPLATLSEFRERDHGMRNFGMHLIPVAGTLTADATLAVSDEVEILEYDEERRAEWKAKHG